jgi:hypothetical protein
MVAADVGDVEGALVRLLGAILFHVAAEKAVPDKNHHHD